MRREVLAIAAKVRDIGLRDGLSFAALRAPFSLYLGWISIATIANVTIVLRSYGITDPLRDPMLTLAIVVLAALVGSAVAVKRADPVFASVFVWAVVGIAVDNSASTLLYTGSLAAAGVCGLAVGVAAAVGLRRSLAFSD